MGRRSEVCFCDRNAEIEALFGLTEEGEGKARRAVFGGFRFGWAPHHGEKPPESSPPPLRVAAVVGEGGLLLLQRRAVVARGIAGSGSGTVTERDEEDNPEFWAGFRVEFRSGHA